MGTDEDIRDLIGRMGAAQRQGFHVTPAHLRLVLDALRAYLAGRVWLAKPRDPHDDAPRRKSEPYTGPLPTIGETRSHGVVACHVQCAGPNCWHTRRFTFEELGLPDAAVFVEIAKRRSFRCQRCGCGEVQVSADWTGHRAHGNGRAKADC